MATYHLYTFNIEYVLFVDRKTMPALYPLFYENLQDNIPSVRQGAALALSNVVRAYGEFRRNVFSFSCLVHSSFVSLPRS